MTALLRPLALRLRGMVRRAVVELVNDALRLQGLQLTLLAGELADDVERFQEYGFTSVPEPGAEAIVLAVGASRSHLVVVATDDRRYRPTGWGAGEAGLYSKFGQIVRLKADGSIELTPAAGQPVTVNGDLVATGNVQAGADVVAAGEVQDAAGTMQAMRLAYNAHTHPETGGQTGVPAPLM